MPTQHDKDTQDLIIPPVHSDEDQVDWLHPGYINRPLATPYTFPGRGNEPHGFDNTTKTLDFTPDLLMKDPIAKRAPGQPPDYEQVHAPRPLAVTVVSQPLRSYLVETKLLTVLAANITTAGAVGTILTQYARQLVGYDDTRDYFTVNTPSALLWSATPNYVPALSPTPDFNSFYVCSFNSPDKIEGKAPWYVAPIIISGGGNFPLMPYMGVVVTRRLVNVNP